MKKSKACYKTLVIEICILHIHLETELQQIAKSVFSIYECVNYIITLFI
jgi:hypothetical protein